MTARLCCCTAALLSGCFLNLTLDLCTHHLWYMCMVSICILVAMYYIDSISQLCYWSLARALSVHDDVPGKPETTACRQCRLNSVLGRMPFSDLYCLLAPLANRKHQNFAAARQTLGALVTIDVHNRDVAQTSEEFLLHMTPWPPWAKAKGNDSAEPLHVVNGTCPAGS